MRNRVDAHHAATVATANQGKSPQPATSSTMARSRNTTRRRKIPPMVEPLLTPRILSSAVATFVAAIVILLSLSAVHTYSKPAEVRLFRSAAEIPTKILAKFDAVLVLGGGVPKNLQEPPVYVQRRCDDAAAVVHRCESRPKRMTRKQQTSSLQGTSSSLPILCLSAGTAHMPQLLSADGLPIWESTSSAAYLQKLGLDNIYVETTSYDTIGNAFYARTSHTDLAGWKHLLIVTNEFHMARTQAIFDWIFKLDTKKYELYFLSSPNVGLSNEAVQARNTKERSSLEKVKTYATMYRSMGAVWAFLHEKHALYTAEALVKRAEAKTAPETPELIKKSYGGGSRK